MQNKIQTSLKNYNSFGIDVISKNFIAINSKKELKQEIKNSKEIPIILGEGTNILFKNDIKRAIIKIDIKGIKIIEEDDNFITVKVGGGEKWTDLVNWAISNDFGGLENLSLIPGSVGSAPVQNIGAYGVEIKNSFEYCETISLLDLSESRFSNSDCKFSYRSSIFKEDLKGKYVICYVHFKLTKKNHKINYLYEPLKKILIENGVKIPTIQDISKYVTEIRKNKLPDPSKLGNCGSFFQNPIIDFDQFEEIRKYDKTVPKYLISENKIKVPAAWLIEKSGFKGVKKGNTGTYRKHALIILNLGGASGREIYNFSKEIKNTVLRNFNILLKEEVNIIDH